MTAFQQLQLYPNTIQKDEERRDGVVIFASVSEAARGSHHDSSGPNNTPSHFTFLAI